MGTVPKPKDHILPFGVYRGKTLEAIAARQGGLGYLKWVLAECKIYDRVLRRAIEDFVKERVEDGKKLES